MNARDPDDYPPLDDSDLVAIDPRLLRLAQGELTDEEAAALAADAAEDDLARAALAAMAPLDEAFHGRVAHRVGIRYRVPAERPARRWWGLLALVPAALAGVLALQLATAPTLPAYDPLFLSGELPPAADAPVRGPEVRRFEEGVEVRASGPDVRRFAEGDGLLVIVRPQEPTDVPIRARAWVEGAPLPLAAEVRSGAVRVAGRVTGLAPGPYRVVVWVGPDRAWDLGAPLRIGWQRVEIPFEVVP